MNISISIENIAGGLFDFAGKNLIISPRRRKMLNDLSPLWKMTAPAMSANFRQVWSEGQSSWAPLSAHYLKWKKAHGYSSKKNVRTGLMYDAMRTGQINAQLPRQWVWGIDRGSSEWIAGKSYTPYPEHANKLRHFVRLTKEFMTKLDENQKKYLGRIFKRGS